MSTLFQRAVPRTRSVFAAATSLFILVSLATPARANDPISVVVDQAKLVRLPGKASTIVVGNPLIADVSLQTGGTLVVTGKGYGTTNVMALDTTGAVILERMVRVEGPSDKLVTIYRGVERESYSCAPICQRRIMLGDTQQHFAGALTQSTNLATTAMGMAADPRQ